MGLTNFPHGVSSFGVPILAGSPYIVSGKVFFVCSNTGSDNNDGLSITKPKSTIAGALLKCTATSSAYPKNDIIYVLPTHSETFTAALTLNKAGVIIKGLGGGSHLYTSLPTLTGNGAIDMIDITANGVVLDGFQFGVPGTDDQTAFINVNAATGVVIRNIFAVGSTTAKNVVDCITVVAASHNLLIENVQIYNTTVAVNSFISLEGACSHVTIKNCNFFGAVVAGGIIDGALTTNLTIQDTIVHVTGSSKSALVLDSNPTGQAVRVFAKGTNTTLASNVNYGNALALFEVRTAEDYSVQGAIIPAADTD